MCGRCRSETLRSARGCSCRAVSVDTSSARSVAHLRYSGSSVWRKNTTCSSFRGRTKPFATLHNIVKFALNNNSSNAAKNNHLSNIVSISAVPNSDSLEREFGWHSSAATTCTRCCNKMHIACLMAGRRLRNLAYLYSPSFRGRICALAKSFSHKLWTIRCSFSRSRVSDD